MDANFLEKTDEMHLPKELEDELKMAMPNRDDFVSLDTHPQLMRRIFACLANCVDKSRAGVIGSHETLDPEEK